MKTLRVLCAFAAVAALRAGEPEKNPAPLVACIEPSTMRTEAAQFLPGSKKTVMVPAREDELGLSRLTKEEFAAAGLTWNQFVARAATAAAAHLRKLKPDIRRDKKGTALYAVLKSESHLTASIILCPEFFAQFRESFGDRLVVLMPNRFTVYVFPRGFSDFQSMGPAILGEFEESVWPCSQEAFEITSEGLKCLGAFDTGEGEPEKPAPAAGTGKAKDKKPRPQGASTNPDDRRK